MAESVNTVHSLPIREAVAVLKRGGLVAFPTETVYGLGADASNPSAVVRIYRVKGRPASHPVIVHIGDAGRLECWAREVPNDARKLAARFWPGPLTLVLTTTAEHVSGDLGDEVDLILDGGPCEIGIESTIIDLSRDRPVLLRPGRISTGDIAATLGATPKPRDRSAPRAPGTLESHYAPRHPLRLIPSGQWDETLQATSLSRAVLSFHARPIGERCAVWIRASTDPQRYARNLYSNLRVLDASGCDEILVEEPPASAEWAAVRDRLLRARSA